MPLPLPMTLVHLPMFFQLMMMRNLIVLRTGISICGCDTRYAEFGPQSFGAFADSLLKLSAGAAESIAP